jgi:DNA-binding HxlR family transcriptional regulator
MAYAPCGGMGERSMIGRTFGRPSSSRWRKSSMSLSVIGDSSEGLVMQRLRAKERQFEELRTES